MTRFKRSICFLPLLFLLIIPNLWAVPTPLSEETELKEDPLTLITHLQTELRAKQTERQQQALTDVISLSSSCAASCTVELQSLGQQTIRLQIDNTTGLGSLLDLSRLNPDVLRLYETGSTDGVRLMALSALMGLADEAVIESLITRSSSQSPKVRGLTHRVVAQFFVTVYPDLLREGQTIKSLSLEEVAKVRKERSQEVRRAARQAAKQAKQAAVQSKRND